MFKDCSIQFLSPYSLEIDEDFFLGSCHETRIFSVLNISGVQSPLWVWNCNSSQFIIVDGYARWRWAKESGCSVLPCLVFPGSISRSDLIKTRVLVKISEPDLCLEQKAAIVERLLKFYPMGEVERKFLPLLRFPSRPGFVGSLMAFLRTSEDFRVAVNEGVIDEKVALRLATWDEESRCEMFDLLKTLRCSVSIQREILDYVEDIGRMKGTSFSEVLKQPEIGSIVESTCTAREKTEYLRRFLRSQIFPHLMAKERRFADFIKNLALPAGVEFKPPQQFEGDEWEVNIRFSKPGELIEKMELTLRRVTADTLDKMMYGD